MCAEHIFCVCVCVCVSADMRTAALLPAVSSLPLFAYLWIALPRLPSTKLFSTQNRKKKKKKKTEHLTHLFFCVCVCLCVFLLEKSEYFACFSHDETPT